jgi:hypothetical protein
MDTESLNVRTLWPSFSHLAVELLDFKIRVALSLVTLIAIILNSEAILFT